MSISQRRGVISLLPKEDLNFLKVVNWRPITLLNVDYKIASKVIATRLEKVLDLLISPDQTHRHSPSRRMPGHIREFNRLEPHSSHDLVFKIWRNNKTEATFAVFCL